MVGTSPSLDDQLKEWLKSKNGIYIENPSRVRITSVELDTLIDMDKYPLDIYNIYLDTYSIEDTIKLSIYDFCEGYGVIKAGLDKICNYQKVVHESFFILKEDSMFHISIYRACEK